MTTTWPDTARDDPPADHPHATALWLLGRHPQLAGLVDRIPGAVETDEAGPFLELHVVADAVRELDAWRDAMAAYRSSTYEPGDNARWYAWSAAGPQMTPGAEALGAMSRTEQGRVRLLAFWAGPPGVLLDSGKFTGFDDAGQRLVADWCDAVRAQR